MECNHEWIFIDKKIASEVDIEYYGYQKLIGIEYIFHCKKCLELRSVIKPNKEFEIEYIFKPFSEKVDKNSKNILSHKEIIEMIVTAFKFVSKIE